MKTKLLHVMTLLKIKNKGKHCNLSASLSYPDILRLLKIIPTKLVNTQYHTIFYVPAQKDTLGWIYVVEWNSSLKHVVKLPTMCQIKDSWQRKFYHVWQYISILAKFCRWELKRLTNHFSIVMCSHHSPTFRAIFGNLLYFSQRSPT